MDNDSTIYLSELQPEEFVELAAHCGGKPFHGKILRKWYYKNLATSFDVMTDLPRGLREALAKRTGLYQLAEAKRQSSKDGTVKVAYSLADGNIVEVVAIPARSRTTLCLSSQVGCGMGCKFCASGLKGHVRNLTSGEMVEQFLLGCAESKRPVTNVVFMGTGEPLLNLKNLVPAIRRLNHPDCAGFGARRVTVSTIGLPDRMVELADAGLQINLAVSLHAPNDEKREQIVPAAKKVKIADILEAAQVYRKKTTRDVTFEYVLIGGFNDSDNDARELARLLKRMRCAVNLIAFNEVPGLDYRAPAQGRITAFLKVLQNQRVPVTMRRSRGRDIDAACGQLRLKAAAERKAAKRKPE